MSRQVFISHVYEDAKWKDSVREWARSGRLGADVVITGETADVRQEGEAAVRAHLHPRLRGAAAVVLLVGNTTHNHPWIDYEVGHALSDRKRVVAVRIPGTSGGAPSALCNVTLVTFEPEAVARALRG